MSFAADKKNILKRPDLSQKGSWDAPILPLLEKINSTDSYFTTSSCSGRIVLISRLAHNKDKAARILNSHKEVETSQIEDLIWSWKGQGVLHFIFEGLILHITCKDQESAIKLLNKVLPICKHSGIIAADPWRLEIKTSERIELPVAKDGIPLIESAYIPHLIQGANDAFKRNQIIIEKIKKIF